MELTPRQIKMMKHAIGFTNPNGRRDNWKPSDGYEAFRNRYYADKKMPEWERLVADGLAISKTDNDMILYQVTEKGASVLSDILETKITL